MRHGRGLRIAGILGVVLAVGTGLAAVVVVGSQAEAVPVEYAPSAQDYVLLKGSWGSGTGQFGLQREYLNFGPAAFTVDRQGFVYVADWGNRRVQLFDNAGTYVDEYPYPPNGTIQDITVSWDGTVFVIDSGRAVGWLDPDAGEIVWGLRGDLQTTQTFRVRATDTGHVYLEEQGREDVGPIIRKYHADSLSYLMTWVARDLCLDPYSSNVLYGVTEEHAVADGKVLTVSTFDPELQKERLVAQVHVPVVDGEGPADLEPRLVGVDGSKRLHVLACGVAEKGSEPRLLCYSRQGGLLGTTWLDGLFADADVEGGDLPSRIRVDGPGNVYVSAASLDDGFVIHKLPAR